MTVQPGDRLDSFGPLQIVSNDGMQRGTLGYHMGQSGAQMTGFGAVEGQSVLGRDFPPAMAGMTQPAQPLPQPAPAPQPQLANNGPSNG